MSYKVPKLQVPRLDSSTAKEYQKIGLLCFTWLGLACLHAAYRSFHKFALAFGLGGRVENVLVSSKVQRYKPKFCSLLCFASLCFAAPAVGVVPASRCVRLDFPTTCWPTSPQRNICNGFRARGCQQMACWLACSFVRWVGCGRTGHGKVA